MPEWFAKTGRKQIDLARHLKVSPSYISQVCRNEAQLSVARMKATADFFGCHMEDLNEWIYD